jgi:NDP-sugar pyrophosphorylase family protein
LQCVILAGGLGTRLGDLSKSRPKHLVPVLGEPFAQHQLKWLRGSGVTRVVYSIGYKGEQIREFVGDGSRWGLEVVWVEDGPTPLGTGGPLRLALRAGLLDPRFCLIYGDSYLPLDLSALFAGSDGVIMSVLRNRGLWGRSNALFADGKVTLYRKGPPRPEDPAFDAIDYGATVLTREALERLPEGPCAIESTYEQLSLEGKLGAFEVHERFHEVGSPEGVAELEAFLTGR